MGKNNKTYKEQSRINWLDPTREKPTHEQVQTGCLQRIADASEAMAKNFNDLIFENQRLKQQIQFWKDEAEHYKKSASSYKGKYTHLKNHQ